MTKLNVNINDSVTIQLTQHGLATLLDANESQCLTSPGVARMPLWKFARVFGLTCYTGSAAIAVGNVIEISQT